MKKFGSATPCKFATTSREYDYRAHLNVFATLVFCWRTQLGLLIGFLRKVKMIKITDPDLLEKISQIEGPDWIKHHALWEDKQGGTDDFTIASARRMWQKNPRDVNSIYGAGGWHRYFVRESGEVVFSYYHSALRHENSENARKLAEKVQAAGFRTSEEI